MVVALAVSGCGRLHFGDTPDAPTGHDEDGDGIPDRLDPCPHVAGDLTDTDGDGVGDACDPEPGVPAEHFLVFATMQPGDQPFDDATGFDQEPDALHAAGDAGTTITLPLGTERVDIGFEIRGLVGSGQHQVGSGIDRDGALPYYFTELNQNTTLADAAIVSYDSTNGYVLLDSRTTNGMHPGVGFLRYDAIAGNSPAFALLTGWTGELYSAHAAAPAYQGGTKVRLVLNGLDIAIRYVAIIETTP